MKTLQVVFHHTGENSDTAKSPLCLLEHFTGDLSEKITCCINWDNDGLIETPRFAVYQVTLPDWLTFAEWQAGSVAWSYLWGFGADPSWPEAWQRGLLDMEEKEKFALIALLNQKAFRSEFRASLRAQLVAWLETPPALRIHRHPLSPKQARALINRYIARDASNRASSLYYAHRYRPDLGAPAPHA